MCKSQVGRVGILTVQEEAGNIHHSYSVAKVVCRSQVGKVGILTVQDEAGNIQTAKAAASRRSRKASTGMAWRTAALMPLSSDRSEGREEGSWEGEEVVGAGATLSLREEGGISGDWSWDREEGGRESAGPGDAEEAHSLQGGSIGAALDGARKGQLLQQGLVTPR